MKKSLIKQYIKDYFPSHDNAWFVLVKSKRTLTDQIETAVCRLIPMASCTGTNEGLVSNGLRSTHKLYFLSTLLIE
ncbi:MAG: hypothetical protein ABIR06_14640 [Cyclobacteriaceae bacterium]